MSSAKRYNPSKKRTTPLTGILLYLLPSPILLAIVVSFFTQNSISIIKYSICYGLFFIGAKVAKKGFNYEKIYQNSALAKAPRLPYKTIGATIISFATFFTSMSLANSFVFSLIVAFCSLFGFYLFYGFDPKEDKIGDLKVGVRAEDIIDITTKAESKINSLKDLRSELVNKEAKEDLDTIIKETESIINSIKEDPNDLSKARKFFNIYLDRTYDITTEFVKNLKRGNITNELEDRYKKLLSSMKNVIKEQKDKLNDDDILSLDIQMEALVKQLNQEGV